MPLKIAVVGAGPAGLSFSVLAAERGHEIFLFDSNAQIGGQFLLARNVPGKQEFDETLRYYQGRMEQAGVTIKVGHRTTAAELAAGNYDKVVVACGVSPRVPQLPGIECSLVVSYTEVLSGRVVAGKRVVIMGGGGIAFDTALYLLEGGNRSHLDAGTFGARWGIERTADNEQPHHDITMVQRTPGRMGKNLGKTTGWIHREVLRQAGVRQLTGATYEHVDDRGLGITIDGESRFLEADTIIICAGQTPENSLFEELQESGGQSYLIGGAKEATGLDAERAIDEGTRLAACI